VYVGAGFFVQNLYWGSGTNVSPTVVSKEAYYFRYTMSIILLQLLYKGLRTHLSVHIMLN